MPADFTTAYSGCGEILTEVNVRSSAVTYDSGSNSIRIYSEDASLSSSSVDVTIRSYLSNYSGI